MESNHRWLFCRQLTCRLSTRAKLNCRSACYQTRPSVLIEPKGSQRQTWCAPRESDPHAFRPSVLSALRMPFRHTRKIFYSNPRRFFLAISNCRQCSFSDKNPNPKIKNMMKDAAIIVSTNYLRSPEPWTGNIPVVAIRVSTTALRIPNTNNRRSLDTKPSKNWGQSYPNYLLGSVES